MVTIKSADPRALAKRAFFLAYQAAGAPFGMGFLQAQQNVTEDHIYDNVVRNGDYAFQPNKDPETRMRGDYVFGRMLKLSITVGSDSVTVPDHDPRPDYQAWCTEYPTYRALIEAAEQSLAAERN